jgi:hypothetical protein
MAIWMTLTAFIGFSRTYYLSSLFHTNATISGKPFSPMVHVHAILFSAWLVLLVTQTTLVAAQRVALHRKLGIFGGLLAVAMISVGTLTAFERARLGAAPPGADPFAFLAVPLGDIGTFAIFIALAFWWRSDKEKHKRLIVLASTCLMTAAWARWPGILAVGPLVYYGLTLLFPIAGIIYDKVTRGRVHPAYLWGAALFVLAVPLRIVLLGNAAWQRLMQHVAG